MSSVAASPLKPLCANSASITAPSPARKPSTASPDDATPVKAEAQVNAASDAQPPPQAPAADDSDDEVVFGRTDEELAAAEARRRDLFSKMYLQRNGTESATGGAKAAATTEHKAPDAAAVPTPITGTLMTSKRCQRERR